MELDAGPPRICPEYASMLSERELAGSAALWHEALALLLRDAYQHHRGKMPPHKAPAHTFEQAYDDVVRCGPMLRWCCEWLDQEAEAVSMAFRRMCET